MVLEAARKCRYCGYRFDGPTASQASEEGLFAHLFRRAPRHLTMTETLEQLGVELDPGEQPDGLWLGQVSSVDGYVVLTDARLFFVMSLRHQKAATTAPWQRQPGRTGGSGDHDPSLEGDARAALARLA